MVCWKASEVDLHYISADLEGCSGFRGGRDRERNDRILREHIRAAAEGLRAGGEGDVALKSFHGIPEGLPGFVRAIRECPPGEFDLPGLGAGCDGLVMLGFHGLAPEYAFGHCYRWGNLFLNGERMGEVAVQTTLAASRGVPTVLFIGDDGGIAEAQRYAPASLTVRTRSGLGADEGDLDEAVIAAIREAARSAARRTGEFPLPALPEEFHLEAPMRTALGADLAEELPYPVTRRGDIVGRRSREFVEVYRFLLDLFGVCNEVSRRKEAGE